MYTGQIVQLFYLRLVLACANVMPFLRDHLGNFSIGRVQKMTIDAIGTSGIAVFIDSNIVLEALPLDQLPWKEIDPTGPIHVLLVPTLLKEVDSKKRDGRLGQRAREFNRLIAPLTNSASNVQLRCTAPDVFLALVACKKTDWEKFDDLDSNEGDDKLIANILHAKDISIENSVFISQDNNPLFTAKRHGIKTFRISEKWLPQPEQSPSDREIAKLKRRIADLEKTEPEFVFEFKPDVEEPTIYRVAPLQDEEIDWLIVRIRDLNPKPGQMYDGYGMPADHTLDSRYEKFFNETIPEFAKKIHSKLEERYGQVLFKLTSKNVGIVHAQNLRMSIQVIGGWVSSKPIYSGLYPRAPQPQNLYHASLSQFPKTGISSAFVGRHEVEVPELQRNSDFIVQCADFHQDQDWLFEGSLWIDNMIEKPCKLIIKLTAANLHGSIFKIFEVQKKIEEIKVFDLIDRNTGDFTIKPMIHEFVIQAYQNKQTHKFELDMAPQK